MSGETGQGSGLITSAFGQRYRTSSKAWASVMGSPIMLQSTFPSRTTHQWEWLGSVGSAYASACISKFGCGCSGGATALNRSNMPPRTVMAGSPEQMCVPTCSHFFVLVGTLAAHGRSGCSHRSHCSHHFFHLSGAVARKRGQQVESSQHDHHNVFL